MMDLKGKISIVTGGSRGIGRAISIKLSCLGSRVIVNYSGSRDDAEEVVNEIVSKGGEAESICCDISNYDEVKKMFDYIVQKFGSIDILINNAGITRDALLIRMSPDDFDKVLSVNLKGTFNCIKSASKYMIKQRSGKIVNISSVVGITGNAGQANYSASKAGVIGLTKSAAKELAGRNINVNAVAPGFIETPLTDLLSDNLKKVYMDKIPLKMFGTPKEVADAVAFLCSNESKYITGQVINVDGGMVM